MNRIVYLDDVFHEIAKQYSAHNELVPMWLDLSYIPKAEQTNTAELSYNKNCNTCKHNPPSKKFPCVDCDMRTHDRFEKTNTAEWITVSKGEVYECSNCRYKILIHHDIKPYKFCPNCGARMKEEKE